MVEETLREQFVKHLMRVFTERSVRQLAESEQHLLVALTKADPAHLRAARKYLRDA